MHADLPIACSSIFMAQIGASAPLPEFVIMTLPNRCTYRLYHIFKAVAISHHIDCSTLGPKCPVQASRPWQLMPNRQSKITKHHDAKQSLSAKRVAVANFSPKFIASFCIGDRSTPSCCLHTDERSRTQPYHPPTIKQEHASHFLQSLGLHPMIQLHRTLNPPQQRHRRNTSTQALRT